MKHLANDLPEGGSWKFLKIDKELVAFSGLMNIFAAELTIQSSLHGERYCITVQNIIFCLLNLLQGMHENSENTISS
jgi:hypothetical protein